MSLVRRVEVSCCNGCAGWAASYIIGGDLTGWWIDIKEVEAMKAELFDEEKHKYIFRNQILCEREREWRSRRNVSIYRKQKLKLIRIQNRSIDPHGHAKGD